MQQAILALSTIQTQKPHIPTYGKYAVEIQWPLDKNDVDLYVQDPNGLIAYFANMDAGEMHLEHDDLGDTTTDYAGLAFNYERVVLRGFVQGEYVVNTHLYWDSTPGTTKVTVMLWNLQGQDRLVKQTTVILHQQGDEKTAFRFTLNGQGNVTGTNDLQKKLVNSVTTPDSYGGGPNGPQNTPTP